jgi:hypothetical protein
MEVLFVKRSLIVFLALMCAASLAFAADAASSDAPLFAPGNITAQINLGSGFFYGLDLSGGAEYGLGTFKIASAIPLTYGAAARLGYAGWSLSGYTYSDVALAALGTLHLSWKDVLPEIKWLSKLESYVGLGLGLDIHNETWSSSNNGLKLAFTGIEGNNWYITPKIAINLEEGYFGYGYGGWGRLGLLIKL